MAAEVLGGVHCSTVAVAEPRATVLYLHGGGYRMGSAPAYAGLAGRIALAARARVVVADYRLAPEYPFPAALHDAAAVHDALRTGPHRTLVLAGDSAGGGLAAALAARVAAAGGPAPDGLVLLSPWLDLRCIAETFTSRAATDPYFPVESAREAADQYLQGHPAHDPLASPVLADPATFPPTLVHASSDETLLDDTLAFAARLAKAGVAVTTSVWPGLAHAWPMTQPQRPETDLAVAAIGRFVSGLARGAGDRGPRGHPGPDPAEQEGRT